MAKKSNNKYLIILFVVLAGIFAVTQLFDSGKSQRSFRSELTSFDSSKVSALVVYPVIENGQKLTLERNGDKWHVVRDDFRSEADLAAVNAAIPQLLNIPVKRLAATTNDRWAEFEVTDSAGTRVKILEGSKTVSDIVIGKFSVNQQMRTFTTFARVTGEEEVYAVDGFLGMTFNRDLNSWRDKTFVKFNKGDITKITVNQSGQSLDYQKIGADWNLGGAVIDSTAMDAYLSGLALLNGADFANGFTETTPISTINLEGNNMQPIAVKGFTGSDGKFVFQSNLNPKAYFSSDSTGIFNNLINALPFPETD
ncbi:MAG: DUF4340 domain-containing protein [Bacteroidota bacterium]